MKNISDNLRFIPRSRWSLLS